MEIRKMLDTGLINISKLAKGMYPNLKYPEIYLNQKVKGISKQRLSDDDCEKIKKYIEINLDCILKD